MYECLNVNKFAKIDVNGHTKFVPIFDENAHLFESSQIVESNLQGFKSEELELPKVKIVKKKINLLNELFRIIL